MEQWEKGDVQISLFDVMANKDKNLNATAVSAISKKYYGGKDFKGDWIRNFHDEVMGHTHWLTFEYLVVEA